MEFIFLFLHRAISGAQNGLGYARHSWRPAATIALIIFAVALMGYAVTQPIPIVFRIAAPLAGALGLAAAVMADQSFAQQGGGRIYDIHFWETICTGAIWAGTVLAGGNILLCLAAVYPALILHKGFVNLGSGLPWWDKRTDDTSGKTFSIPFLGISIPRAPTQARVLLAVASLLLAALATLFDWRFFIFAS